MNPIVLNAFLSELELIKQAFQTSQFSGPLSYGPFPQVSSIPAFRQPQASVKAVAGSLGKLPHAGSVSPLLKGASEGFGTTITHVSSPARVLNQTQSVGRGAIRAAPGPSIAAYSKPVQMGKGSPVGPNLPGAQKSSSGI